MQQYLCMACSMSLRKLLKFHCFQSHLFAPVPYTPPPHKYPQDIWLQLSHCTCSFDKTKLKLSSHTHAHTHTDTHAHAHVHTHTHTHTHTLTHSHKQTRDTRVACLQRLPVAKYVVKLMFTHTHTPPPPVTTTTNNTNTSQQYNVEPLHLTLADAITASDDVHVHYQYPNKQCWDCLPISH